ncbi:TetR/AcrR family transcriptional regulator [Gimesia aquarii]|uniref:Fatty acid metabolism regulator protein n=1 Tax=Gimesia aquarii TaxID=2527964 RepID=A0A517W4N1_9PLAN|nr:TetR/AcrR family transcriptional regulator [Gimesia aquarii]QDU00216.1 Fatty acid metabolism regulator protein [Gimesia aquarii]
MLRAKSGRRISTEQRRREILDAALACFLDNGVAGTTIEQIRIASKASHGSIYHLFRSKNEIALTLFVEGMHDYHRKILQALENESTAYGCMRAMITTHLQDVKDDPPLALYLTRLGMADDLGEISEQYRSLNDDYVQSVWPHFEPFVKQGEIVRHSPELYISLIVGPAIHLCRSWLRGRVDQDLLSATNTLVEAAWMSLQPK